MYIFKYKINIIEYIFIYKSNYILDYVHRFSVYNNICKFYGRNLQTGCACEGIRASIAFRSAIGGLVAVCYPFFAEAFVLLEVYSPRNATQGGAVVFMLNQLQAQPLRLSVDLI